MKDYIIEYLKDGEVRYIKVEGVSGVVEALEQFLGGADRPDLIEVQGVYEKVTA